MAFDFGAALSTAGQVTPALQQAQENQRERARQDVLDKLKSRELQQWVPVRSYATPDGAKHTVYLTPTGYQDKTEEPSFQDQAKSKLDALQALYKQKGLPWTPEIAQAAADQVFGLKVGAFKPYPGEAGKPFKGTDGQWYVKGTGPDGQPVEQPMGPNYQPPPSASGITPELRQAQLKLQQSKLALEEAKFKSSQDPNNPVFRLKLRQAQSSFLRDQAYWMRAQASVTGTLNGQPLPGANLDAEGRPVGAMFQGNVKPTSTEIGRADLAASALDQMDTMGEILLSRSDLFGPVAGRTTNFSQWIGSQDPDAQRFQAAARVAADHLAGVFGGRSQAALQHIYDVIGKNQTNPEAAIAALDQMGKAAQIIKARGTRKTVGGVPQNADDLKKLTVKMRAPNGQVSSVPADQVEHYKKLGAVVVQ